MYHGPLHMLHPHVMCTVAWQMSRQCTVDEGHMMLQLLLCISMLAVCHGFHDAADRVLMKYGSRSCMPVHGLRAAHASADSRKLSQGLGQATSHSKHREASTGQGQVTSHSKPRGGAGHDPQQAQGAGGFLATASTRNLSAGKTEYGQQAISPDPTLAS